MDVRNAVALVTGANRGLGLELVRHLVAGGASRVYAGVRDRARFDAAAFQSDRVLPLVVDVTKLDTIVAAAAAAADVTLLVNNAGVLTVGDVLDVGAEVIESTLATNLYGILHMAQAFVPVLKRQRHGAILNVLSLLSLHNAPFAGSYCISKFAAWSLTQSLRSSLAGQGISVFAAFPGGIDTDMLAGVAADKDKAADVAHAILAGLRLGKSDIYPDPSKFRR